MKHLTNSTLKSLVMQLTDIPEDEFRTAVKIAKKYRKANYELYKAQHKLDKINRTTNNAKSMDYELA